MSIDDALNEFEDEDGDGVPDIVETAAAVGIGGGITMMGLAMLANAEVAAGPAAAIGVLVLTGFGIFGAASFLNAVMD